jgi:hypothetical protein
MGFFERFKDSLSGKTKSERMEDYAKEKISKLKEAVLEGKSSDETYKIITAASEFNECIGHLSLITPTALALVLQSMSESTRNDSNNKNYKKIMRSWENAQENCNDFFRGSAMTYWVMAVSIKDKWTSVDWPFIDNLFNRIDEQFWSSYRRSEWWRVAWFFKLAEDVEAEHGPASCTSERLFKAWEKYDQQDIIRYLDCLPVDLVSNYMCTTLEDAIAYRGQ